MTNLLAIARHDLRGTDTNTLLRMADHANDMLVKLSSRQDCRRAEKALQRIAAELERRKVPM